MKVDCYEITTSRTRQFFDIGSANIDHTHLTCTICGATSTLEIEVLGKPSEEYLRSFAAEHGVHKRGCTAK